MSYERDRAAEPGGSAAGLLPCLPLLAVAGLLAARWESLPARFPIHWNARLEVDGWAERTPVGVYGPLILGAAMIAMIALLGYVMRRGSRPRDATAAAAAAWRENQRVVQRILRLCQWQMAAVFAAVGLAPIAHAAGRSDLLLRSVLALAVGIVVTLPLYLLVLMRRSRRRLAGTTAQPAARGWRRGGFYYWDDEDPAIFVQKLHGIGYTLNFARPGAWVALAAMLGIPLAVVGLLVWLG